MDLSPELHSKIFDLFTQMSNLAGSAQSSISSSHLHQTTPPTVFTNPADCNSLHRTTQPESSELSRTLPFLSYSTPNQTGYPVGCTFKMYWESGPFSPPALLPPGLNQHHRLVSASYIALSLFHKAPQESCLCSDPPRTPGFTVAFTRRCQIKCKTTS